MRTFDSQETSIGGGLGRLNILAPIELRARVGRWLGGSGGWAAFSINFRPTPNY